MCAIQAVTALVAVAAAGVGLSFLDPVAALLIAAVAMKEGRGGWRGQNGCCTTLPGLTTTADEPASAPRTGDCCA